MSELKRIILEMGTGNDLKGQDYTKASCRAVNDALHHSFFPMFDSLNIDPNTMHVDVHVACQKPDAVDLEAVASVLPYGKVKCKAVFGGQDVVDEENNNRIVIANAGIIVKLPINRVS